MSSLGIETMSKLEGFIGYKGIGTDMTSLGKIKSCLVLNCNQELPSRGLPSI